MKAALHACATVSLAALMSLASLSVQAQAAPPADAAAQLDLQVAYCAGPMHRKLQDAQTLQRVVPANSAQAKQLQDANAKLADSVRRLDAHLAKREQAIPPRLLVAARQTADEDLARSIQEHRACTKQCNLTDDPASSAAGSPAMQCFTKCVAAQPATVKLEHCRGTDMLPR